MFLVRLIYTSTAVDTLKPADYQSILTSSIKNNTAVDITGMLCCDGRYFLQCLEGSRIAVNRAYSKILNDPRHKDIMLLNYGEVADRHFSEWSMGYIALSSNAEVDIKADLMMRLLGDSDLVVRSKPHAISQPITRAKFLKYSVKRDFDPYSLNESSALALLEDLAIVFRR